VKRSDLQASPLTGAVVAEKDLELTTVPVSVSMHQWRWANQMGQCGGFQVTGRTASSRLQHRRRDQRSPPQRRLPSEASNRRRLHRQGALPAKAGDRWRRPKGARREWWKSALFNVQLRARLRVASSHRRWASQRAPLSLSNRRLFHQRHRHRLPLRPHLQRLRFNVRGPRRPTPASNPHRGRLGAVAPVEAASAVVDSPPAGCATEAQPAAIVPTPGPAGLTPEERAAVTELYGKALESFDRLLVMISGGALVLSLTFLHNLAPRPLASTAFWLWVGWGGLVLSLVLIVSSMLTGHKAIEHALENSGRTDYSTATTVLNITSVAFLVAGLIGLVMFAQRNMFASACPDTITPPPPLSAPP
jgi:hypothetical protein